MLNLFERLIVGSLFVDNEVQIAGPQSNLKHITFYNTREEGTTKRWGMGQNTTAESGANAGSNFVINAYDDSGVLIGAAITITRSSRAVTFGGAVTFSSLATTTTLTAGTSLLATTFANVGTYLRVGSSAAPNATSTGDLTVGNYLSLGTNAAPAAATGYGLNLTKTITDVTGTVKNAFIRTDYNPSGATTSLIGQGFQVTTRVTAGNAQAFSELDGATIETRPLGSGTMTAIVGLLINGVALDSTSTFTAATDVHALRLVLSNIISGSPTGTITNGYALRISNPGVGSGPLVITTLVGIDIAAQTRGTQDNIGIRVGIPSGGSTINAAIQLSDTGGTAPGGLLFGTDTNLYRSAADTLASDDKFNPGKAISTTAGGALIMTLGNGSAGLYVGSGVPTITAPQGSVYLRTDGSSTSTRLYVNTTGSTTWTNVTTAA